MTKFTVYIDESGDPGLGKIRDSCESTKKGGQSAWFCVGAIIVREETNSLLPALKRKIIDRLQAQFRDLHFYKMSHAQKIVACQEIASEKIGICFVASNKKTIQDSPKYEIFKGKGHLYNYLIRYLLERVTFSCRKAAELQGVKDYSIKPIFSKCGYVDYHHMKEYFLLQKNGKEIVYTPYQVDWNKFDLNDMRVELHSQWSGLQLSDICTSAFSAALEPDNYGNLETRYAEILAPNLIIKNNTSLNHGLTIVPPLTKNPLSNDQSAAVKKINEIRIKK